MYSIRQEGDRWQVLGSAGDVLADFDTYELALAHIAAQLTQLVELAAAEAAPAETGDGLLPEAWTADGAICFSTDTGDGRDFAGCTWTSRDPAASLLPLMLQTETDMGHFGAVLAGFIEELTNLGQGTNPGGRGRFYDSDAGRAARDLLLGGRRFGVSVDPGAVEFEWTCVEEDADGWCIQDRMTFTAYEIIGLTMTPFPAFAEAAIVLDDGTAPAPADAVAAAAAPTRPPADWFAMPEPGDDDDLMVGQPGGRLGVPLTITEDGQVYGHLALWGQCHRGNLRACTEPPTCAAYSHFHTGSVICDDGSTVNTGPLTVDCDHAPLSMAGYAARDHYANAGLGWADVRVVNGAHGPWVCGALRPNVTDEQVRVLRALELSGDWRRFESGLELVAGLAVNSPGFPIAREALAASSLSIDNPMPAAAIVNGEPASLVASGRVTHCASCAERELLEHSGDDLRRSLADVLAALGTIERRTRHLMAPAVAEMSERVHVKNHESVADQARVLARRAGLR